jgi:acetyltransferase-like isoleucine patch superfamily enzyme
MIRLIRLLLCRMKAARSGGRIVIGRNLRLDVRFDIKGPGRVAIGDDVYMGRMPGDRRSFVTIYTHAPEATVRVGDRTRLYAARISSQYSIEIGADVVIEESGIADTDFHAFTPDRGAPIGESLERCRVTIGDGVAIGSRSIVTKGVVIGKGALVAPGSIVTRDLPSRCKAGGNPARPLVDG